MIRLIRELINYVKRTPDQEASRAPATASPTFTLAPSPTASTRPVQQKTASIDALVNGGIEFESRESNAGLMIALQEAYNQMGADGIIATMPYLIAGKAQADQGNYLWQKQLTALTEENFGIDKRGRLGGSGQRVVLIVHGGGILTPDRIRHAYSELTPQGSARYTDDEFDSLLNGVLPSGESIDLYTVDHVRSGRIPYPFGRYGVWMPAETAESQESEPIYSKTDFMNNEIVIARVGTLDYLDAYFDKAQEFEEFHDPAEDADENFISNYHIFDNNEFKELDFHVPQGRMLVLDRYRAGLDGYRALDDFGTNLRLGGNFARFVGVLPEMPDSREYDVEQ